MEKTYTYEILPEYLYENWETKHLYVNCVDKDDDTVYQIYEGDFYTIDVIDDSEKSRTDFTDYNIDWETECEIRTFVNPRTDEDHLRASQIKQFVIHQFLTNPSSQGVLVSYFLRNNVRFNTDNAYEKIDSLLKRNNYSITRDSELVRLCLETDLAASYIHDLYWVRLEAPRGSSFFLGESPLFLLNLIDSDCVGDPFIPYGCTGTILFMPLSPEYAVAIYDGEAYNLKTKTLTRKDVETYNAITVGLSQNVILSDVKKEIPRYRKAKERSETEELSIADFRPSVFSVKKDCPGENCGYREYVRDVMEYDRKYLSEKEDIFDIYNRSVHTSDTMRIMADHIIRRIERRKQESAGEKSDGSCVEQKGENEE